MAALNLNLTLNLNPRPRIDKELPGFLAILPQRAWSIRIAAHSCSNRGGWLPERLRKDRFVQELKEASSLFPAGGNVKQSEQRRGDTPDPVLFAIVAKSLIDQATAMEGKEKLIEIVSMCVLCRFHAVNVVKAQVGLIRSNSPSRDV